MSNIAQYHSISRCTAKLLINNMNQQGHSSSAPPSLSSEADGPCNHPNPILLLFLILQLFCAFGVEVQVHAQKSILLPGDSFSPSSPPTSFLLSNNTLFQFGFRQLSQTQHRTYYLCIWYANLTGRHIVWTANRDHPVAEGSSLSFAKASGRLTLVDENGTTAWTSPPSTSSPAKQALLHNSGNLLLTNGTASAFVWQSFDYPTDTLLPTQKLLATSALLSRNSAASNGDLATGIYKFSLFANSFQLTLTDNTRAYWTVPPQVEYPGSSYAAFDDATNSLSFYSNTYNARYAAYLPWDWDNNSVLRKDIRRLSLDFDGNLRMYRWNPASLLWYVVWVAVTNQCDIPGICGPYAYCVHRPQPSCLCPAGFVPIDKGATWLGCNPINKSEQECSRNPGYIILDQIDYPFNDLIYISNTSLESCQAICSQSCSYVGFVYGLDNRGCWMKSVPLKNGYAQSLRRTYLKVYGGSMPVLPYTDASYTLWSSADTEPYSATPSTVTDTQPSVTPPLPSPGI